MVKSDKEVIRMKYTSLEQALAALDTYERKKSAYDHAMGVLYLDATTVAPSDTWEGRSLTMEVLSEAQYNLETDPEIEKWLYFLEENAAVLTPIQQRKIQVIRKKYDQTQKIPQEEYVAFSVLQNEAQSVWHRAKEHSDFAAFAPYLEKILWYNKRFAGYYNPDAMPYDALLNEYEEGMTMQTLDAFFEELRNTIVPLMAKVKEAAPIDDSFLYRHYPVEKQRIFSDYLMEVLGMDRTHSTIAETEHPYTTNFNNKDVRITTHYYEDNLVSSMFSVIHEGGHALYELGADDCYNYSVLSGGVSMGIHESQSRFYENIIGRSKEFVHAIFPKLKELFPDQMFDITEDMFYRAINKVEPGLIRIESDELSYCLHIMVRYEIEKKLIEGSLEVRDIPAQWNMLYRKYLGVDVPNDRQGCLQDSHWSGGSIGYFPSYALGSAYGPQMLKKMETDLPNLWEYVSSGDLSIVNGWLKDKIHRHASFLKPGDLLSQVCGNFDAKYYTEYLTKKYMQLYDL